jgi:hypothetical protein
MKALVNSMLLPLITALVSLNTSAQTSAGHVRSVAPDTIGALNHHPVVAGGEVVLMVTDRETYIAGEHVWYSMNVTRHGEKPLPRSIAGYAELLNCVNMPVAQSRILLDNNGFGSGMLTLPDTLSSGDYLVRGYTRAMTPYGAENYFSKLIRVFNPYSADTLYDRISLKSDTGKPGLELFTESGQANPGQSNRIIVRAWGSNGMGNAVKVVLAMQDGQVTYTLFTDRSGLGSSEVFLPGPGTLVAGAVIDSVHVTAELPVRMTGVHSLSLEKMPAGNISVTIRPPGIQGKAARGPLHLAVISPGKIVYYKQIPAENKDITVLIPSGDPEPGINEALLYDSNGSLLSSRLFMIDPPGMTRLGSEAIKVDADDRTIGISLPSSARFATLSVTCEEDNTYDTRVMSLLEPWLTATGMTDPFIRPFLAGSTPLSDELLITLDSHVKQQFAGYMPETVAETHGLVVSGTAVEPQTLRKLSGQILFINIPGKECFLQYARSDTAGMFSFIVPPVTGTKEIVIYPMDTTTDIIIKVNPSFSTDYVPLYHSVAGISAMADGPAQRMSINSQVTRIYEISDIDTLTPEMKPRKTKHFFGSAGQHLLLSDYIPLPNMEEIFFELIPGIEIIRKHDGYIFRIYDPDTGREVSEPPLMFIDGTYTSDPSSIATLAPDKTEYIDVLRMRYRFGGLLLPPIISVITREGDFRLHRLPQAALRINYHFADDVAGFSHGEVNTPGRIPVYRNTLFWSAAPCDDGNGELVIKVPRPDYDGKSRITLSVSGDDHYMLTASETADFYRH